MSVFEYLGVLLSVIMGLGVTHILAGVSKTVHHRKTLKLYWVHSLWAANILIYIVIIWWGMFWWNEQTDWSFFEFMLLILYAVVLFLAASLLYPWNFPEDLDFEQHYFDTRKWFFSVTAFAWVIDIPETVLKSDGGMRNLPDAYVVLVAPLISLSIFAAYTNNRLFHKFYAVFYPLFVVGYLSFTTLSEIATR